MSRPVIIIGAGGHAAVVADTLLASGRTVLGLADVDPSVYGRRVCGLSVLGNDDVLDRNDPAELELANGLGGTRGEPLRRQVQVRLQSKGWRFCSVRHPSAVVSPFAVLGPGVQLMAACVIQPGARLGEGCVVNTGAVVEHDAEIGAFVHVAPGVVVCGGVRVGEDSHVGAGAVLRQGVELGRGTLVGVGAVVIASHAGGATLVGVPARPRGEST